MAVLAIVEDDGPFREEIAEELRFRGHIVHEASNGEDGFALIERAQPDLVLSDIDMPRGNGFDLMRRVRSEDSKYADVSFLFLSGRNCPADVLHGLKTGADDYITKPIDFEFLGQKIDTILRKKDRLIHSWSEENVPAQIKEAMFAGSIVLGGVFALGFVVLLLLYYFKSAFGIDIFKDAHLSDILGF